jgi:hypothetical protein
METADSEKNGMRPGGFVALFENFLPPHPGGSCGLLSEALHAAVV